MSKNTLAEIKDLVEAGTSDAQNLSYLQWTFEGYRAVVLSGDPSPPIEHEFMSLACQAWENGREIARADLGVAVVDGRTTLTRMRPPGEDAYIRGYQETVRERHDATCPTEYADADAQAWTHGNREALRDLDFGDKWSH